MNTQGKYRAIFYAICAALCYALSTPFSKLLLEETGPVMLAAFLYIGAGLGIGAFYILKNEKDNKLSSKDFPYTAGMVVLDIIAPILLMLGLKFTSSAHTSLLNNFEIVATSIIAFLIFKEKISKKLLAGIALVTIASMILSYEGLEGLGFSWGSVLVLAAAACWGLENNCTRMISSKNTFEIVAVKGIFSGSGALLVAWIVGEKMPSFIYAVVIMILGFFSYGMSIHLYIKAQEMLGAAKTSAFYAIAPFAGVLLSVVLLNEKLGMRFFAALTVMAAGSAVVIADTIEKYHSHMHTHLIVHYHGGSIHTHTIEHSHTHRHISNGGRHIHIHHN